MPPSSINQDKFLQNQGIEVQGSDFLKKILHNKDKGIKEEYNLLDVHGRRLSRYWEPGDTLASVAKKRIISNIRLLFNPDTYTAQNFKDVKETVIRQKIKILGFAITIFVPLSLYYHFLRPKISRVKRLYIMQFYNKMGFLSKELGVKTKKVSQKDLENSL